MSAKDLKVRQLLCELKGKRQECWCKKPERAGIPESNTQLLSCRLHRKTISLACLNLSVGFLTHAVRAEFYLIRPQSSFWKTNRKERDLPSGIQFHSWLTSISQTSGRPRQSHGNDNETKWSCLPFIISRCQQISMTSTIKHFSLKNLWPKSSTIAQVTEFK